jgi:hypothetical protein
MSERQRKTALRIANVPREEFEALVESDDPPTITELAERGTQHIGPSSRAAAAASSSPNRRF